MTTDEHQRNQSVEPIESSSQSKMRLSKSMRDISYANQSHDEFMREFSFFRKNGFTTEQQKEIISSIEKGAKQYRDSLANLDATFIEIPEYSSSPLHRAVVCSNNNIDDVKETISAVLQSGIDINHIDEHGNTPLMHLLSEIIDTRKKHIKNPINIIKFLVERGADLDLENKKGKSALDFINDLVEEKLIEQIDNVINTAEKALQKEAKNKLSEYVQDIKDVSIYGSCAKIQLKDDKNEFKISEFLNSDFCKQYGILSFSTLHGNEKSGMHGVVSNGIRHYTVTDGSYEMTLNWYVEGKECNIKININADGSVKCIEDNGVTDEEIEAHQDVKLGNLSLFDALKKGRWKDQQLSEVSETIRSGIMKNHLNTSEIGKFTPLMASTPLSHSSNPGGVPTVPYKDRSNTPPPIPTRSISLTSKSTPVNRSSGSSMADNQSKSTLSGLSPSSNEQSSGYSSNEKGDESSGHPTAPSNEAPTPPVPPAFPQSASRVPTPLTEKQLEQIENAKRKLKPTIVNNGKESERGSAEKNPLISALERLTKSIPYILKEDVPNIYKPINSRDNQGASDAEWAAVDEEYNNSQALPTPIIPKNVASSTRDGQSQADPSQSSIPSSGSDSGYSSPTHTKYPKHRVNPKQLGKSLRKIEQGSLTLLEEFLGQLDENKKFPLNPVDYGKNDESEANSANKAQIKKGLKPVDQNQMSEMTRERVIEAGLLQKTQASVGTTENLTTSENTTKLQESPSGSAQKPSDEPELERDSTHDFPLIEPELEWDATYDVSLTQNDDSGFEKEIEALDALSKELEGEGKNKQIGSETAKSNNAQSNPADQVMRELKEVLSPDSREISQGSRLDILLKKNKAQLKIGVIEGQREDDSTKPVNSNDRTRVGLGNQEIKLSTMIQQLWVERIITTPASDKGILRK